MVVLTVLSMIAVPATSSPLGAQQAAGPATLEDVDPHAREPITREAHGDATRAVGETVCNQPTLGPVLCRPIQTWSARYDGPGERDEDPALAVGPSGDKVYVTAASHPEGGNFIARDYVTVAYEATTGLQLWSARYDGPADRERPDEPAAIDVSPDGNTVYVTGTSDSGAGETREDIATIAYDADTGDERWVTRSDGPGGFSDEAGGLTVDPEGGTLYVTGQMHTGFTAGRDDVATIAYDADTGDELWRAFYDGPDDLEITEVGQVIAVGDPGETVYVAGTSDGERTREDYVTAAYDAHTGEEQWVARYDGADGDDRVSNLDIGPDADTVFVTGTSWTDETGNDHATVAYDAETGDERWVARHDHAGGYDRAHDVEAGPDGSVFVTGEVDPEDALPDIGTFAYDAETGEADWMTRYDGPAEHDDGGLALGVTPDGKQVIVTGFSTGQVTGYDIATIAYDAETGTAHLAERYNGGEGFDLPRDLALTPDGDSVHVTGVSLVAGTMDIVTIGYERPLDGPLPVPLE